MKFFSSKNLSIRLGESEQNMHKLLAVKILSSEFNTDFTSINSINDKWQLLAPKLETRRLNLDVEALVSNSQSTREVLLYALKAKSLKVKIYQENIHYISGHFYIQNMQLFNKQDNLEHIKLKLASNGKFNLNTEQTHER